MSIHNQTYSLSYQSGSNQKYSSPLDFVAAYLNCNDFALATKQVQNTFFPLGAEELENLVVNAGSTCFNAGLKGSLIQLSALQTPLLAQKYKEGLQERLTDLAIAKEIEGLFVSDADFKLVEHLLSLVENQGQEISQSENIVMSDEKKLIDARSEDGSEYIEMLFSK